MMRIAIRVLSVFLLLPLLASCGSEQQMGQTTQSYKDTKTIVLDILKSEDGLKAIQTAAVKNQDGATKLLATGDGQQLQLAVKDVLTAPGTDKLLQKTMTDPRFAGEFAKATQSNMKQLHKDLMRDPEYQQQMIQVMNNPEYQKLLLQVMKGAAYRQQIMSVMQESLQSPLYRVQLIDMMKKVVEEETAPGGQAGLQEASDTAGGKSKTQSTKGGSSGTDSSSTDSSSSDSSSGQGDSSGKEKSQSQGQSGQKEKKKDDEDAG
jgi:spore germination protein D